MNISEIMTAELYMLIVMAAVAAVLMFISFLFAIAKDLFKEYVLKIPRDEL